MGATARVISRRSLAAATASWRPSHGRRSELHRFRSRPAVRGTLPRRLTRIIGREDEVRALSLQLLASRFVSIVGAGGVGKTTVAVALAHALEAHFAGEVLFVDLGSVAELDLVAPTLAAIAGLSAPSPDPLGGLIAHLSDKRVLIILDTCEHLTTAVAPLAARLVAETAHLHVLATSREALRVEGEHVHRLEPLACPPSDPKAGGDIRAWPAAELFLHRAGAGGAHGELSQADAAIVARICDKLGGVPLAIEMVASRVATHGLEQVAALLERQFALVLPGQRTAPPRQRTLSATLDWSYALLEPCERKVLARLAVFVGEFVLDGALSVAAASPADHAALFGVLDSLVEKSMVATRPVGASIRYRLFDTTRAYVKAIAVDPEEAAFVATRHAVYFRDALAAGASGEFGQRTERPDHSHGDGRQCPCRPRLVLRRWRRSAPWCRARRGCDAGVSVAVAARGGSSLDDRRARLPRRRYCAGAASRCSYRARSEQASPSRAARAPRPAPG